LDCDSPTYCIRAAGITGRHHQVCLLRLGPANVSSCCH
jgi:hypothetical protein